jgi:hypothetical protein
MTRSTPGSVVTFYSWKGGVGRTMALANVAVQLARMGNTVLVVDWDLEAPGLDRYFLNIESGDLGKIEALPPANPTGLMGLLCEAFDRGDATSREQDWRNRVVGIEVPKAQSTPNVPKPPVPNRIDFLPSGYGSDDYASRLAAISWAIFFADSRGGEWLEELRDQWADSYDFILIDSRTGLTDSGGVCTIQMPHVLVLVFTANDQSVDGGLRVVEAAQRERRNFGYDRGPLVVIPILSRWEGESEVDIGEQWMKRFDHDLAPLTAPWLPKQFSPRHFLEKTRVPHVPRFAFGEPLPVLTHSLSDPSLPGLYFDTIARLIRAQLANVGTIIDPDYNENLDLISASAKVFISYRREDSAGSAGRIFDRLSSRFGRQAVFVDFDTIPIGANFATAVEENVAQANVLVAIIGPNWLKARDGEGERRLNNPNDFVRLEISAALQRNIPVIPVLVDGASPPRVDELPDDLKVLARRQSIEVSHTKFDRDMDKLSQSIRAGIELK